MKKQQLILLFLISMLIFTGIVSVGCKKQAELGTEENPIIWSFVPSGEMERVAGGAQEVADMLHDKTGYFFKVSTNYNSITSKELQKEFIKQLKK